MSKMPTLVSHVYNPNVKNRTYLVVWTYTINLVHNYSLIRQEKSWLTKLKTQLTQIFIKNHRKLQTPKLLRILKQLTSILCNPKIQMTFLLIKWNLAFVKICFSQIWLSKNNQFSPTVFEYVILHMLIIVEVYLKAPLKSIDIC